MADKKRKRDSFGELREKRAFQKRTTPKRSKSRKAQVSPVARPKRGTKPARVRKLTALERDILARAGVKNPQDKKKKKKR